MGAAVAGSAAASGGGHGTWVAVVPGKLHTAGVGVSMS